MTIDAYHECCALNFAESGEVLYFIGSGQLSSGGNPEGQESFVHDRWKTLSACLESKEIAFHTHASDQLEQHKWRQCALQGQSYTESVNSIFARVRDLRRIATTRGVEAGSTYPMTANTTVSNWLSGKAI